VYGDDGDNSGESLILLLLFLGDTYLSCTLKLFEENEMLYISFFSFLSGGYLVPLILLSDTCPFLPLVSLFLFFEGGANPSSRGPTGARVGPAGPTWRLLAPPRVGCLLECF